MSQSTQTIDERLFTHLEQYVIRAESEFRLDDLEGITAEGIFTEETKLGILERFAADLAREPLKVKALAAYYLENVVHDGGVRGGILDRALDEVIDVLIPYVHKSQPGYAAVLLDGKSVPDGS